jgi:predicted dehydrogenase
MKKVVWGVLGAAKIALNRVIPGITRSQHNVVRAIASRSVEKAQAAAANLGLAKAYGSYEALLADPEIEAIYNPLPNHLHVPMTLAAAAAGKHVLCEKPIAIDAAEAEQMRAAAGKVRIMEAFMVRFHPQWLRAREIAQGGVLGDVRSIQVGFSYFNADPENIRNRADLPGAGALYDIGCYAVTAGRFLFGAEPTRAIALITRDAGVDVTTSGLLDFPGDRRVEFTVSMRSARFQRVTVTGEMKRLEIAIPFNPEHDRAMRLTIDDGGDLFGAHAVTEIIPPADQYALQADAFALAVRGEAPLLYGVDDAIAGMRVIDALYRSEKTGVWENV